jgi:Cdc6-like AAA superfamily ATPase
MKFILMGSVATYTKKDAFIAGIKFRDSLRVRFPGIATKVYIKSMMPSKTNKRFWEVKLPSRGNFYNSNISIFQKLINFTWLNQTQKKVVAYIFWKRDSTHKNYPLIPYVDKDPYWFEKNEKHHLKYYKLRILINVDLEDHPNLDNSDLELKGQLETLASGIQNSHGHGAAFIPVHQKTWYNILDDDFFEEDHIAFIDPEEFDFTFLGNIPLKKSLWLEDENVELEPNHEKDPEKIILGSLLYRGNLTNHKKTIKINHLHQRVLIAGNNGVGKTTFIIDQLGQINSNQRNVGFVYVNTVKPDQDTFFKIGNIIDLSLKWSSPDCRVPYYTKQGNIYDTARYIIAQLGLKNFFESNLIEVLDAFIKEHGSPPKSIEVLLQNLVKFIEADAELDSKTKYRRISYLRTQIAKITRDTHIIKNLELTDTPPKWFSVVTTGGGVFLDLSECKSRDAQKLFLCALFNYLKDWLPQTNELKVIIVIDEAHRLFQEQSGYHVHDDDFISFKGFQDLMAEFIEESRSQGISFIFIDQDPKLLMSKVRSAPMVHFIFSLDEDNAKLLAHNKEQEELINNLGNREVFCRNKITKERFLFRTNDITPFD